MSQYNYFTDAGLTALLNSLKTTKGTAEGNTSAISELETDFQEMTQQVATVVGDVASCLQELDTVKADSAEVEQALEAKQNTITGTAGDKVVIGSDGKVTTVPDSGGEYVSIRDRIDLTSGLDLDTLTSPGCYRANTVLVVNSLLNLPTGFADNNLILDVYKNNEYGFVTQRIRAMTKEFSATRSYNDTWGAWTIGYSEHHKPAASEITAGTFPGKMVANATSTATVTTSQIRNIYANTTAMTSGSTALTTGAIYLQYE